MQNSGTDLVICAAAGTAEENSYTKYIAVSGGGRTMYLKSYVCEYNADCVRGDLYAVYGATLKEKGFCLEQVGFASEAGGNVTTVTPAGGTADSAETTVTLTVRLSHKEGFVGGDNPLVKMLLGMPQPPQSFTFSGGKDMASNRPVYRTSENGALRSPAAIVRTEGYLEFSGSVEKNSAEILLLYGDIPVYRYLDMESVEPVAVTKYPNRSYLVPTGTENVAGLLGVNVNNMPSADYSLEYVFDKAELYDVSPQRLSSQGRLHSDYRRRYLAVQEEKYLTEYKYKNNRLELMDRFRYDGEKVFVMSNGAIALAGEKIRIFDSFGCHNIDLDAREGASIVFNAGYYFMYVLKGNTVTSYGFNTSLIKKNTYEVDGSKVRLWVFDDRYAGFAQLPASVKITNYQSEFAGPAAMYQSILKNLSPFSDVGFYYNSLYCQNSTGKMYFMTQMYLRDAFDGDKRECGTGRLIRVKNGRAYLTDFDISTCALYDITDLGEADKLNDAAITGDIMTVYDASGQLKFYRLSGNKTYVICSDVNGYGNNVLMNLKAIASGKKNIRIRIYDE